MRAFCGGIAQLARAPALQAGGHRFESDYLHQFDLIVKTTVESRKNKMMECK